MNRSPVRVALIGALGRMGQTIIDVARDDEDIAIVAQCDQGDSIASALEAAEVAIDFSLPEAIEEICNESTRQHRPLVIGTTGHSAEQRQLIETTAKSVPIVFASNFSVGVNALFWLTARAAAILGEKFEPQIVETHHLMKKDAPSGTAKTLAEALKKARHLDREVPIESIREGDVVGEHVVRFTGPGERLELIHRAESRANFAKGALMAARWVLDKPPGLYNMQNVLGL